MVELHTFVSEALTGILKGVRDARVDSHVAIIAPIIRKNTVEVNISNKGSTGIKSEAEPLIQLVEFDIAVTVTEEKRKQTDGGLKAEAKGGALLQVIGMDASIEAGAQHQKGESVIDNRVSRIKFSVPVLFTGQPYEVHSRIEKHLPEVHIGP